MRKTKASPTNARVFWSRSPIYRRLLQQNNEEKSSISHWSQKKTDSASKQSKKRTQSESSVFNVEDAISRSLIKSPSLKRNRANSSTMHAHEDSIDLWSESDNDLTQRRSISKKIIKRENPNTQMTQMLRIIAAMRTPNVQLELKEDLNFNETMTSPFIDEIQYQIPLASDILDEEELFLLEKCESNWLLENSCFSESKDAASKPKDAYRRFTVIEVEVTTRSKILRLSDFVNQYQVILSDSWSSTDVFVGDVVHIVGTFTSDRKLILDHATDGFIVVHPDTLVSGTTIAGSIDCIRRGVLTERIRILGSSSASMLHGVMAHDIFEDALNSNSFDLTSLQHFLERAIQTHMNDLYSSNESEQVAREKLHPFLSRFHQWSQMFLQKEPKENAWVQEYGKTKLNEAKKTASISKVVDIEENIWSPMHGIKGKIDASVLVCSEAAGIRDRTIVPLELKTGRVDTNASHNAQTILYTLLMEARYGVPVPYGLLYNAYSNNVFLVPKMSHEVRSLVQLRNSLAKALLNQDCLPPMIENSRACERCYNLDACLLYHKAKENGAVDSTLLPKLFQERTRHMTNSHAQFYSHWDRLLALEETDMSLYRSEIWSMTSAERAQVGRCMDAMVITRVEAAADFRRPNSLQTYRYHFSPSQSDASSLLSRQFSVGDPVVISSELGHVALSIGFIIDLQPSSVVITTDRLLRGAPKRIRSDSGDILFPGLDDFKSDIDLTAIGKDLYRVDKNELISGLSTVRGCLMHLVSSIGDPRKRRLIIDLEPPETDPVPLPLSCDINSSLIQHLQKDLLNRDQQNAVQEVYKARDYSLILGMPGCGKTKVITHIIHGLIARGKTVLLTSYTHTAVDNVLLKLKEAGLVHFLRVGNSDKVHPELRENTDLWATKTCGTVQELRQIYDKPSVVATTCLGVSHPIFTQRRFDYCIVDEASQITLPVCLCPLQFAGIFVLVGDHYQLPPLVRNAVASDQGLSLSLFKRLSEAHPEAISTLTLQYRMAADIQSLSSSLIYNDRLRCGAYAVAEQSLQLPQFVNGTYSVSFQEWHHLNTVGAECSLPRCWLIQALNPSSRVVFLNTVSVPAPDARNGELIQNHGEAVLTAQLVSALIAAGLSSKEIGVLSFYRAQLKLIQHQLRLCDIADDVEVHTVDKYQGRDKQCIILSFVRSNPRHQVGDLLQQWQRLNVALTRARAKLIMIGDVETLRAGSPLLATMVKMVQERKWVVNLPQNALDYHSTRTSGSCATMQPDQNLPPIRKFGPLADAKSAIQSNLLSLIS